MRGIAATRVAAATAPRSPPPRAMRRFHAPARGARVAAASSQDPPRFVRDSRDEARAAQPLDAGKRPHEIEAFIGALGSSVDSAVTQALQKEFGVADRVRVCDGRGGATKVQLTHASGAYADVYLRGGVVSSWVLASGGEVLYAPDDSAAGFLGGARKGGSEPFAGGVGVAFGADATRGASFVSNAEWRIVETGASPPFVTLELTDDESSRSNNFPHSFKLTQEISLDAHNVLRIKTTCSNTGASAFEYALGHNAHIAVSDAREGDVYYVGFEDCVYLDHKLHPTKPRVRFTKDLDIMSERCFKLTGPTERVYLCTDDRATGVEVGTGCTVFAQNLSGEAGCVDRAVFNPWEESPNAYRWYAGLGIGNFGKLRVAEPDSKVATEIQFKVVDATPSVRIREEFELFEKVNARNALARPKIDLSDAELPSDMQ